MVERQKQLEMWERILETASNMLERARKMKALEAESHNEMAKFNSIEKSYKFVVEQIESLAMDYTEEEKREKVQPFINFLIKRKLREIREEAMPFIKKDLEMRRLSCNIEGDKIHIRTFEEFYQNLKLKKSEILEDKLYEICVILMVANEANADITEENFFEEKEDFYDAIKRSNDPILMDLSEGGDVAKNNFSEIFLSNI